jgi:hypothetical protein
MFASLKTEIIRKQPLLLRKRNLLKVDVDKQVLLVTKLQENEIYQAKVELENLEKTIVEVPAVDVSGLKEQEQQ